MKRFKLILADNDGTLVTDDRVLTERTKRVLTRLHEEGYLLGLASGRGYVDLCTYPEKWGLGFDLDVYVSWNGAELYDGVDKKLYRYNYLSPETIREIVELVNPLGASPNIPRDNGTMVRSVDSFVTGSASRNKNTRVTVVDTDEELYTAPAPKVMYRMTEEKMEEFESFVKAHPSKNFISYKTQSTVFEFVTPETEKSYGVKKFCQLHDITLDEVISFGDTTNDNTMLACTYGVCMANGSEDTKAVSKEITRYTNNEDGLADYIETHILNNRD